LRRHLVQLIGCLLLVLVPLGIVVATGTTPQLGLDLQGGISVVLGPTGEFRTDTLSKAVDIIRNRVDALGVAEPDVSRQGNTIVVDLPGVENRDRARELVGTTAELRFRPVLQVYPGGEAPTTTTAGPTTTTTTAPGGTTTTAPGASTTASTTQGGTVIAGQATPSTTAPATPPTTAPEPVPAGGCPITNPKVSEVDDPAGVVVLPFRDDDEDRAGTLECLGPTELTGEAVRTARSKFESGWGVTVEFTREGSDQFDALAAKYFQRQVAIVLDGVVISDPNINAQRFGGTAEITGSFTEAEARDLALVLRYGALPVELEEEQVRAVSPTLGRDQLRSGVTAGIFGVGLVALYTLLYYRLLGIVIWAGLLLSAASLYTITAWLSEQVGLTLTLAGVTGMIVSIGYTVDSYVVYFERLKDEVRSGKTIRSSLDRGFARSFRTIMAGNLVSLIGAAILYFLAVGSVRGFAFFLGLSTLLDIFVAYFFMHPLVSIIGRNPKFSRARWLGVASGLGVKEATA
jgi:preprotein translocase subunit SecD